jgi:hypothetical protein
MIDTNLLFVILAVAASAFIVYAIERYTRRKSIDAADGIKVSLLSGAGAGGLMYALGDTSSVTDAVASAASSVEEMFVGKPSF